MPNEDPEVQIKVMEDQQIITAAAYFIAYNSVVGLGQYLITQDIVTELKKHDTYDDVRLYNLIRDNKRKIDEMVGAIFNLTVPE